VQKKKTKRNRTNGSARQRKTKTDRINRWQQAGINIGSINIAGVSLYKIFMLLESHTLDVLCLQETWLPESTVPLNIPGY
jgi:hypothetical protein